MNRCIARLCVAILLSAVPVCHSQTVAPVKKPKPESPVTVRQAAPKPSCTNTVSSGTNTITRRLHSMIEKASESQFLQLVSGKQAATGDIRAIRRLFREKQAVLKKINDNLAADYSIDADRNYRYDTSSKTIYELVIAPGTNAIAGDGSSPAGQGRVHMVLDGKEKVERFVQLSTAKQLNSTIVKVLAMLDQEKEKELASQNNALLEKFKVSKDRSYEYDAKTGALYELATLSADGSSVKR